MNRLPSWRWVWNVSMFLQSTMEPLWNLKNCSLFWKKMKEYRVSCSTIKIKNFLKISLPIRSAKRSVPESRRANAGWKKWTIWWSLWKLPAVWNWAFAGKTSGQTKKNRWIQKHWWICFRKMPRSCVRKKSNSYPDISAPRLPRQERKPMRQRICSPSMQSCGKFWITASGLNSNWNARRPARKSGNWQTVYSSRSAAVKKQWRCMCRCFQPLSQNMQVQEGMPQGWSPWMRHLPGWMRWTSVICSALW